VHPALELDQVVYRRGTATILDGVSLALERGETVALLGRSGSGKSTLLQLINALLWPSAGEVRVEGRPTREWDPIQLRRRIGFVLQEGGLFPHFTVARNVALVPTLERWPEDRVRARVDELLALVGLEAEIAGRFPAQLSGGQRQRVGVARALAADPPLLLCDEPFGALDPLTRAALQREFVRLRRSLRKSALFVTHDLREALVVADRIALLDQGRLVVLDTPAGFLSAAHPLAAAYRDSLALPAGEPAP
jgi:osmoprotectant transport system ATP-binding protein